MQSNSSGTLSSETTLPTVGTAVGAQGGSGLFQLTQAAAWIALLFSVAILVWSPSDSATSVAAGDSLYAIALALVTFVLVGLSIWFSGGKATWSQTRLLWLFLGMVVLWHGMATGWTVGKTNTKHAIHGFWQSAAFWCLLFCIAWLSRHLLGAARLLRWWWVLGVFVLLYGFWEYGVLQPRFRAELAADRIGLLERQGIDPDSSMAILITNRIESTEIRSFFALANSYAGFLVALWPVWLGWGISVLQRGVDSSSPKGAKTEKWVAWLCIAGAGVALLLTKSRSAWVAVGVGTVLTLLLDPQLRRDGYGWYRRHMGLTVGVLIALLVVFGVVYALDPLIFQEAGKSLGYRMNYWEGAWDLIQESPYLGFGSLNFQSTYLRVKRSIAAETPADPHNFLLEIAHAGGWGLLGLTLFFIAAVGWFGWRARGKSTVEHGHELFPEHRFTLRGSQVAMVLSGLFVLGFAFFTVGDEELVGTALAAVGASGLGVWIARNGSASESILGIVRDKSVLFYVSFVATLVHLLASGGWMLPGTMVGPILALGLFIGSIGRGEVVEASDGQVAKGASKPFLPMVLAAGLLGVFVWSMWLPNMRANYVASQLMGAEKPPTIDTYSSWMESAPYDPDLARLGMEYCVSMFEVPMDAAARERWLHLFQQTRTQFLDRDPKHALAFTEAAKQSMRIGASIANPGEGQADSFRELRGSGRRMLSESTEFFRQAGLHAQSSAQTQLQGAMAAAVVGNWKVSEKMLEKAEEIDRLTQHADRKIQAARVWVSRKMVSAFEKAAVSAKRLDPEGNTDWAEWKSQVERSESVAGEPAARLLRSLQEKLATVPEKAE